MQPAPSVLKMNLRGTTATSSLEPTHVALACDASVTANWKHVPALVSAGGEHALTMTVRNVFLAAIVIIGLSGCSSFHRDWRKAAASPVPTSGIEGRWQGSWVSGFNRHHGRLRCLVSRLDRGQYQARFHAKYQKI